MNDINIIMNKMPLEWCYKWCENRICCCLGCANVSGGLTKNGFTKQDWQKWVNENPKNK